MSDDKSCYIIISDIKFAWEFVKIAIEHGYASYNEEVGISYPIVR